MPIPPPSLIENDSLGVQRMAAPLRRVLMKRPDAAFGDADPERWHYTGPVDLAAADG